LKKVLLGILISLQRRVLPVVVVFNVVIVLDYFYVLGLFKIFFPAVDYY